MKTYSIFSGVMIVRAHCKRDALAHLGYSTQGNLSYVTIATADEISYYKGQLQITELEVAIRV